MYSVIRLLDVVEAGREQVLGELRTAAADAGALRWVVEPTLPGARNGGDILMHLRFPSQDQWDCVAERFATQIAGGAVTRVNGATYSGAPERCGDTPGTVYRALLLRVLLDVDADMVER